MIGPWDGGNIYMHIQPVACLSAHWTAVLIFPRGDKTRWQFFSLLPPCWQAVRHAFLYPARKSEMPQYKNGMCANCAYTINPSMNALSSWRTQLVRLSKQQGTQLHLTQLIVLAIVFNCLHTLPDVAEALRRNQVARHRSEPQAVVLRSLRTWFLPTEPPQPPPPFSSPPYPASTLLQPSDAQAWSKRAAAAAALLNSPH